MRLVLWNELFQQYMAMVPGLGCRLSGDGAWDLGPGSRFLNNLNYDGEDKDKWLQSSNRTHDREEDYGAGVNVWTFGGTAHFNDVFLSLTALAWDGIAFAQVPIITHPNDGVVGVNSARLWNNGSQNVVDTDIPLAPLQHVPWLILWYGTRAFQNAPDLFPILETLLRGEAVPGAQTPQLALRADMAASVDDSVLTGTVSELGTLAVGAVLERPFMLPTTPFAQVGFLANNALFGMRMPDGTLLTASDTLTTPGLSYIEDAANGLGMFRMMGPGAGVWHAVFDASASSTANPYALSVEIVGTTEVRIEPSTPIVYSPSVNIVASLRNSGTPELGVTWNTTLIEPDGAMSSFELHDDGAHQDGGAGDGIFGNTVSLGGPRGVYRIRTQGTDVSGATYQGGTLVELGVFEDVAVEDLPYPSHNSVQLGEVITFSAPVRNLGAETVNGLNVEFWDNQVRFATVTIDLGSNETKTVQADWTASPPDTHFIRIVADPFRLTDEVDYTNNTTVRQVVIGEPIVAVQGQQTPSILRLGPIWPNPFKRHVTIGYALPSSGPVSLTLFDLQGRRVRSWAWYRQEAGLHRITWNGLTDGGHRVPAGVLFARLSASGGIKMSKIVHLD